MTMRNAIRKAKTDTGLRRDYSVYPTTLDIEKRTVQFVASTETKVRRPWGFEVLRNDAMAVDLGRVPLTLILDSHRYDSVLGVFGRCLSGRFEKRKLIIEAEIAEGDPCDRLIQLIQRGMVRSVSVGYRITKAEESTAPDGTPIITATRWELKEISFVIIPADENAIIRGSSNMAMKAKKTNRNSPRVIDDADHDDDFDTRSGDDDDDDDVGAPAVRRQTSLSTRDMTAVLDLRSAFVRGGGNDEDFNQIVQRSGGNIQWIRAGVLDSIVERERETPTDSRFGSNFRGDDNLHEKIIDYVSVRCGGVSKVANNELLGNSLHGVARRYMEERGLSTRTMDDQTVLRTVFSGQAGDISKRAGITTSDYPQLFIEGFNRSLEQQFAIAKTPIKSLSKPRNARDFRPQKVIKPGETPKMERVLESGAIPHGSFELEDNILSLAQYGIQMLFSRIAMINDDMSMIADYIGNFAQGAADVEADKFVSLLLDNNRAGAKLSDGKPLFHADRNNITSIGLGINVDSISMARQVMRTQKNVNGTGSAGVVPAVLLVGPAQETAAEKLVASLNAATIGEANPFSGKLRVEVENRLPGNGWYLFGDPAQRPAFMHAYLDGFEGPHVDSEQAWDTLGMKYRCYFDFGCGVLDWRSAYYNPGEPVE